MEVAEVKDQAGRSVGGANQEPATEMVTRAGDRDHRHSTSRFIRVSHLTRTVNAEHLEEIFANYGGVARAELAFDRTANQPAGFAFVEFRSQEAATKAQVHMDGGTIDGNVVEVSFVESFPPDRRRGAGEVDREKLRLPMNNDHPRHRRGHDGGGRRAPGRVFDRDRGSRPGRGGRGQSPSPDRRRRGSPPPPRRDGGGRGRGHHARRSRSRSRSRGMSRSRSQSRSRSRGRRRGWRRGRRRGRSWSRSGSWSRSRSWSRGWRRGGRFRGRSGSRSRSGGHAPAQRGGPRMFSRSPPPRRRSRSPRDRRKSRSPSARSRSMSTSRSGRKRWGGEGRFRR